MSSANRCRLFPGSRLINAKVQGTKLTQVRDLCVTLICAHSSKAAGSTAQMGEDFAGEMK